MSANTLQNERVDTPIIKMTQTNNLITDEVVLKLMKSMAENLKCLES